MRKAIALFAAAAAFASTALAHEGGGLPHVHSGAETLQAHPGHGLGLAILGLGVVLIVVAFARRSGRKQQTGERHE